MYPLPKRKRRKKKARPVLEQPQELAKYIPVCESCTHFFHYFDKCPVDDCFCYEDEEPATLGRWVAYRFTREGTWNNPVFLAKLIDKEVEGLYLQIEELTCVNNSLLEILEHAKQNKL